MIRSLEDLCISLSGCFKENKRKLNLGKCHLIVSGTEKAKIKVDDFAITNLEKENFLGITFDDRLKFQYHIKNVCKKASSKLGALLRVAPFCGSILKENFV